MEVEAVDEGMLGKILVADGTEGVKVNEPIAVLLEEGEDGAALPRRRRSRAAPTPRRPGAAAAGAAAGAPRQRRRRRPRSGNGARCGRRAHLRLAAGAAHGEAGRASISRR